MVVSLWKFVVNHYSRLPDIFPSQRIKWLISWSIGWTTKLFYRNGSVRSVFVARKRNSTFVSFRWTRIDSKFDQWIRDGLFVRRNSVEIRSSRRLCSVQHEQVRFRLEKEKRVGVSNDLDVRLGIPFLNWTISLASNGHFICSRFRSTRTTLDKSWPWKKALSNNFFINFTRRSIARKNGTWPEQRWKQWLHRRPKF